MGSQQIGQHGQHGQQGVPVVLDRLRSEVGELSETLWAARSREEVMDTVTAIEGLKSSLDALELDAVRELEATHAVKAVG